ncbi:phosphoribosylformylglycinamidine synthase [Streptococcus vestibularis]|uniref:Phosphoribosylformylglycinamidine synthase n=1 Tax=Streptococcus vestibularis F0396 TaxID=904306 RepID=E3CSE0_STRVE|nr:phosphoribosylformylglycinamidine synthase [Streptococcus vestibularis]EFQ58711.1 phosphoribosylformylglycinamidine synthase [Streptococcus vestibularis F0396]MBS6504983.1 phosphoribosylformylglycinamidine synthase [Streptococcus vestibularis]MBT3132885.1 phosphoribosylformylglycinamidine synthase [Streptococcus vestibularis]MCY7042956.1 phosphoribosylformylglycinamidine synthase [Streptococcus vestibularis]MDU3179200.1 phosphoribosylformylglycinamidine synthase [Streptococcus vestibularis]
MDKRIFVEKKADFRVKSHSLVKELKHNLQLKTLNDLRIVQVYDVFNLAEDLFARAEKHIFSEQVTDTVLDEAAVKADLEKYAFFAIESLPGQFDQRAASSQEALLLLGSSNDVTVNTAQLYLVNKDIDANELEAVKNYLLNPVDSRFKDITVGIAKQDFSESDKTIPSLDFFETYTAEDFAKYKAEQGLAMEVDDLLFIQDYFKSIGRVPTETELKVLDTYWSDHCRHTTFETELKNIDFSASKFEKQLQATYDKYIAMRDELGRTEKPQTLMDMATIFGRYERANGRLDDMEVSDEINACSVEIEVDVDGVKEPWLLMFKNETHNHPTEIEPFGGAATCIGGAIRDPLSGRSYVYQAMRISGAGDITTPIAETRAGKLPQQVISKTAAHGYSSYGNQIGLATTYVREYFHPGFVAKRMELGAVVGAAPKENVVREKPEAGDVIILLGGKTGRDGVGGATGSSKVQTVESVETAGAEVQKGNAIEERKIQRLFRNGEVTRLIKKSNDFGAGGVCVAIGELADGLEIDLDKVPLKYQGLNGTEIAISESQERMAVVVRPEDVDAFVAECNKENIDAVVVATVTEKPNLVMHWNGETIVDLERRFLDTNGVRVVVDAKVVDKDVKLPEERQTSAETLEADTLEVLADLNHASQKGLQTIFDSSVGRSTVNHPLGGRYQITPTEASVQKLPVQHGVTTTASVMAQGFNPYVAEWSPYHGAAYAVIEATARLVAAGANWSKARFSYQEYFERMDKQAERFGQPVSALLGSIEAQIQLGLPSIGGKDSMSGTFEELTVPPTLVAFGVTTADSRKVLSPEFKAAGENIYYIPGQALAQEIDFDLIKSNFAKFEAIQADYKVTSASAVKYGGVVEALALATFGNHIGATVTLENLETALTAQLGGFVFTSPEEISGVAKIGQTAADFTLTVNGVTLDGHKLDSAFQGKLEEVYPTEFAQATELEEVPAVASDAVIKAKETVETPVVYIPVFPGTNSEYDSAKAFEKEGAKVNLVPFVTLNEEAIVKSVDTMVDNVEKANIIFFAGGFSAADEPDGSAKFIVNILLNEKVRAAIDRFIERGGLIIGICNGFQALVKSGLLPYGNFEDASSTSPTLFYNDANQHVAKMVETRIANTNSPWLAGVKVGDIHAIPVSHGEGKFVVTAEEFAELRDNGQIFTQYVDFEGKPSMDSKYNPNGSVNAIEGITSKNGQIIGKMGHSERFEDGLFQNIPGSKDQHLFASAVKYFTGK